MLKSIKDKHLKAIKTRGYIPSLFFSLLAFVGSIFLTYLATAYATLKASNHVTDIVLSNTPAFEVDGLFVYGAALLALFALVLIVVHPKRFPFTMFALSLFYTIRAFFITLTHLAAFPIQTPIDFTTDIGIFLSRFFVTGGDGLFFSAHTGAPFLMALIFWEHPFLRYLFLASSVFFAGVVLLGHLHYSIDVASAYFITYTIFVMARLLFRKSYTLFKTSA